MSTPTVREIVKQWLAENGFHGLSDGDECGCLLADFAPCGDGPYPNCQAAKRQEQHMTEDVCLLERLAKLETIDCDSPASDCEECILKWTWSEARIRRTIKCAHTTPLNQPPKPTAQPNTPS